jgi:hypothetical protein
VKCLTKIIKGLTVNNSFYKTKSILLQFFYKSIGACSNSIVQFVYAKIPQVPKKQYNKYVVVKPLLTINNIQNVFIQL